MMQAAIEIVLLVASIASGLCILLAWAHDMQRVHGETALRRQMRRMTKPRQPHITIIIRSEDSKKLQLCLRRIKKSHYKRYDVVAVVKGIGSRERQQLQTAAPVETFRIYAPRREVSDKALMMQAYRRSQRGELIVVVSADDLVEPTAMKKAAAMLANDSSAEAVRLFGELDEPMSVAQLYTVFSELSKRLAIKASTIVSKNRRQTDTAPVMYRYKSMVKAAKNNEWRMRTRYTWGLSCSPIQHTRRRTQWYAWVLRLGFVGVVIYIAWTAATLQSAWPFIMAWIIVCLWLGAAVWFDETTLLQRKILLSVSIPIGMFVATARYIVDGFAAIVRLKTF